MTFPSLPVDTTVTPALAKATLEATCREYGVSPRELAHGSTHRHGLVVTLAKGELLRRMYAAKARASHVARLLGVSTRQVRHWYQAFRERGL